MTTSSQESSSVPVLTRQQLQDKIAGGHPFKLLMAVSDFGFRVKHIPGSVRVTTEPSTFSWLPKDADIVVYCSDVDCRFSRRVLERMRESGFVKLSHYAGGLTDWESAGLPIEGDWAPGADAADRTVSE
jgi:rhodanese-related sulfurtransferase